MKKILIIITLLMVGFENYAQNIQHSDLWLKIDEIRRTKFPETSQYNIDALINCHPCTRPITVILDGSAVNGSMLDQRNLAEIAGIDYLLSSEVATTAIYGSSSANGVILVYTHTYANKNPQVKRGLKITFPAPDLWRTNGNEKKSK